MNRNQKIALGCGGAGCLGLIVVAVAGVLLFYFSQRTPFILGGGNDNSNVNSNTNSNTSVGDNSSSSGSTSMSEDDQHKLFHAASATRDTQIMQRVWKKLGLTDSEGTPNDKYSEFTRDHIAWLFRNADFLQEINSEQKARAYVDAHIND